MTHIYEKYCTYPPYPPLSIFLYNFGFLVSNFIKMYLTFLQVEKEKSGI